MFHEGHLVALHSHTRRLMMFTPEALRETLGAAADRIEQLAGHRLCPAFRPRGGWRSGYMYEGLARIDHTLIGWGWFLWDWFHTPVFRPAGAALRDAGFAFGAVC